MAMWQGAPAPPWRTRSRPLTAGSSLSWHSSEYIGVRPGSNRGQTGVRPGSNLVAALLLPHDVEFGGVGDRHDGHDAGLNRIADDEIGGVGNATGHVQRDHIRPFLPDVLH